MTAEKPPIAIITDSTCNIPPALIEKYHIYVVLQHLIWGTDDLLDLKDIDAAKFYDRLTRDPIHPKTSQPPASEFADMINRAIKDGAKEAMILTVSAALSGTNQSAQQAKEMVDIPVTVYDSRSAGMGLGWQVLAAARARDAGGDINASVEAARKTREHLVLLLMVETLEYLHKGGRIGGAQKLIGTALNLKPRLRVNHETGIIEPVERTRTRAKAIEGIYQSFFKEMDTSRPLHVAIHHAAAERDAALLRDRVENEYHPVELIMNELTPVIGTHVGPGLLGITGYYE